MHIFQGKKKLNSNLDVHVLFVHFENFYLKFEMEVDYHSMQAQANS